MNAEKLQTVCELIDSLIAEMGREDDVPKDNLNFYMNELVARLEARGKLKASKAILDSLR